MHSPVEALALLEEGNERFASGMPTARRAAIRRREELLRAQSPYAVVVACTDSRVAPEIVFDCGLGDIFAVRAAGNLLGEIGMGTVEFVIENFPTKLIAVLGHEDCGAVNAVIGGMRAGGRMGSIFEKLVPLAEAALEAGVSTPETSDWIAKANVLQSVDMLSHSPVLEGKLARAEIAIVGGFYELKTGRVSWITPLPR